MNTTLLTASCCFLVTVAAGCATDPGGGSAAEAPADAPPTGAAAGEAASLPSDLPASDLDPADFVDGVDHELYPLLPGTRWTYEVTSSDGDERVVVEVTDGSRVVDGVAAVVVRDRVWDEDGRLVEDTDDWFAQDRDGNVWYLGEDTTAYDEDGSTSKDGSWEAGVDGARAGIVMPARPQVGQEYPQEYLAGEAEDRGAVIELDVPVEVPVGSFAAVRTRDTTPLEPGLEEHKYYAPGVGLVREETVRGGDEVAVLVELVRP